MSEKRRREKRRREVGGEKKDVEVEVDPYRVLGLPSGRIGLKLSQAEIEEAYERKCFEWEAKEKFLGYPDTSAELLKVEDAYKFLQSHKRRGEFYYRLRTTIERENLRLRRRTTAGRKLRTTAGRMKLKVNREYKNLLHTVNELQNKLNKLELETPKSSGSSDRLENHEDELMIAEEQMSEPNDPSSALANLNHRNRWFGTGKTKKIHLLFEFAIGYALFYARNINEIDVEMFESAEKYINSPSDHPPPLVLEAFHPFSSSDDALVEMNAISKSAVTEQLKSFLLKNLPEAVDGKSNDYIATCIPYLSSNIVKSTRICVSSGKRYCDVMRALRMDLYKFIDLHPGDLLKAQVNLAHLYNKQRQRRTYVGSSMVVPFSFKVAVVPHKFEGLFIAKGSEDIICTKNLVCGEALPGEDLISVENEDGNKVQYRVWNPNKSKLAAAIQCGVTNIWVKPGSRVLYVGNVSGITIFQLSDLVGPDGMVYVVGLCDNIVNLAERRSNVLTVLENPKFFKKYRMVVGMVDVIFADLAASHELKAKHIFFSAGFYLSTGGHYMIATQASDTNLTSQDLFADDLLQREFKHIELVTLEPIKGAYVMYVGGFRIDI